MNMNSKEAPHMHFITGAQTTYKLLLSPTAVAEAPDTFCHYRCNTGVTQTQEYNGEWWKGKAMGRGFMNRQQHKLLRFLIVLAESI